MEENVITGTIGVGPLEDCPSPSAGVSVWDELDAAYQEGVDSV